MLPLEVNITTFSRTHTENSHTENILSLKNKKNVLGWMTNCALNKTYKWVLANLWLHIYVKLSLNANIRKKNGFNLLKARQVEPSEICTIREVNFF